MAGRSSGLGNDSTDADVMAAQSSPRGVVSADIAAPPTTEDAVDTIATCLVVD